MRRLFLVPFILLAIGCSKKEDTPPPYVPHVAGTWTGSGTDNTIGYFDWTVDLVQSGTSASGDFHTSSSFGTTNGTIALEIAPGGGMNLTKLTMSRTGYSGSVTCTGSMSLSQRSTVTDGSMSFNYTVSDCHYPLETGGANLKKIAGTN